MMSDVELLELAARYLEFALYAEGAARLRALAGAPVFCDERAIEVIARYSTMLEEAMESDEMNFEMMEILKVEALRELRAE